MEAKQYVIKQLMGHQRNQRGNKKNIPWQKWKLKYHNARSMGYGKINFKLKVYFYTILSQ